MVFPILVDIPVVVAGLYYRDKQPVEICYIILRAVYGTPYYVILFEDAVIGGNDLYISGGRCNVRRAVKMTGSPVEHAT